MGAGARDGRPPFAVPPSRCPAPRGRHRPSGSGRPVRGTRGVTGAGQGLEDPRPVRGHAVLAHGPPARVVGAPPHLDQHMLTPAGPGCASSARRKATWAGPRSGLYRRVTVSTIRLPCPSFGSTRATVPSTTSRSQARASSGSDGGGPSPDRRSASPGPPLASAAPALLAAWESLPLFSVTSRASPATADRATTAARDPRAMRRARPRRTGLAGRGRADGSGPSPGTEPRPAEPPARPRWPTVARAAAPRRPPPPGARS